MSDKEALEASLALASERVGDPTAAVYATLFARHPEMEALFVRDTTGAIRGHMLSEVLDCALDLTEGRSYAPTLILSERVNHQELGVAPEDFGFFFDVVRDTLKDVCDDGWTPEMDAVWTAVLAMVAASQSKSAC